MIGPLLILAAFVSPEGAVSAEREVPRIVLLDTEEGRREHRAALEGGLAFLAKRQLENEVGSLGAKYQVAITSLAGLAFLGGGHGYDRGTYGRNVVMCVNYLLHTAQSSPSGYLAKAGEDHSMHGHGYAILFLTQVYGELPSRVQRDVEVVIRRGIQVIESARSFEGGWYYDADNTDHRDENSVTVCVLQALRAARNVGFAVEKDVIAEAKEYLRNCRQDDGGFCYSVSGNVSRTSYELTAGAVASLQALGVYESEEVARGLDYLRRCLKDVDVHPLDAAGSYRSYGNFYAAQSFHLAGDRAWRSWYPRAFGQLIAEGKREGWHWKSRFGEEYATSMAVLILEIPLGYLPIFQK